MSWRGVYGSISGIDLSYAPREYLGSAAQSQVHPVIARRANESIPSPRHRAKTAPREQSIRFPRCTSLVIEEGGLAFVNGHLTSSLHNMIEVPQVDV